jgi:hypothetical protein
MSMIVQTHGLAPRCVGMEHVPLPPSAETQAYEWCPDVCGVVSKAEPLVEGPNPDGYAPRPANDDRPLPAHETPDGELIEPQLPAQPHALMMLTPYSVRDKAKWAQAEQLLSRTRR